MNARVLALIVLQIDDRFDGGNFREMRKGIRCFGRKELRKKIGQVVIPRQNCFWLGGILKRSDEGKHPFYIMKT